MGDVDNIGEFKLGSVCKNNFYLHELSGAKPVLSVARNYPYDEKFTHLLGYVAQASEKDLIENEVIKKVTFLV